MPSHRSWSQWTWSKEHKCLTRFRESGKGGQKWEYKNEKGHVRSSYVEAPKTVSTSLEDQSTERPESDNAVLDEDEEDAEDNKSTGTVTQGMSNMSVPSPPLPQWSGTDPIQRQEVSRSNPYSNPPYGRQNTTDNRIVTSYNTNPLPPQEPYPPAIWQSSGGTIRARNPGTSVEQDDRHFKVHESKKFKFGKVFKIMWSEPFGSNGTAITSRAPPKNAGFAKMRRFVIVKSFPGHSLCLPILTYTNQGTLKNGVHPDDHAVIYTDRNAGPDRCLFQGEVLRKAALRMEPDNSSHKLDPASRVNYAKIYTVEHNVKVQFIGALTRNAQAQLSADYNSQHPPIQEIQPDPGYVVHRNPMQSDASDHNQYYKDMQRAQDDVSGEEANTLNFSGCVGLPTTTYGNAPTPVVESDQDSTYTTDPQVSAGYDTSQVQFVDRLDTSRISLDGSYRTPRGATTATNYSGAPNPDQESGYNLSRSGFNSSYREVQRWHTEISTPPREYLSDDEENDRELGGQ